ncbi:hypothetical protein HUN39_18520 [Methylocystis sp. FS]|uniref:hypothetical protein n=1 Tax=Methylocystis silviterrae TaxID=2743612 RepID=UPI001583F7B2|nr:hypothetical protein [Methylocystis silviterrae]NUJ81983.1 hypothetical protein [Methylocystis silviterrae]
MSGRPRSPTYPSFAISEAIEYVTKFHKTERSNAVEREVAAKALGYSGLTGRSATVLSNLVQYGLIERTGKNEVRVSRLAVDILYPDDETKKAEALRSAAQAPELFRKIEERFSDGTPSEAALRAFLIKEGFTDTAIPSVMSSYLQTVRFIEDEIGRDRNGRAPQRGQESLYPQSSGDIAVQEARPTLPTTPRQQQQPHAPALLGVHQHDGKASFHWVGGKIILTGGVIATQDDLDEAVAFLTALRPLLPRAKASDENALTAENDE